jgi:drug/metabolite transporter (DMT)-like permease
MFRPTWHKVVGAFLIVLGITIFVLNDAEWFGVHLMPGGHNELWAVTGAAVAATSTWWFGWFDRSQTRW